MTRPHHRITLFAIAALCAACGGESNMSSKTLVAHRGASAYAPEHTRAAYELAIDMGADYIEPDLQITKDSVLIALHDETLERTTNVAQVFPDRFKEELIRNQLVKRWYAVEFTLDEIKQLDAGSWFDPKFAGERVPTFAEVIEIARGRAGIFPETKAPEVYGDRGYDMERLVVAELKEFGLDVPDGMKGTPVLLQSFSPESLRILRRDLGIELPSYFLVGNSMDARRWFTSEGLVEVKEFATGISPSKDLILAFPEIVSNAHAAGMPVIPYTFGGRDSAEFENYGNETRYFLFNLGVDGLFTNNPDLFPRS
jgi:glycerophosphoryl diester phosphodiesterase